MSSVAAHKRHAIGAHRSEAEDRTYGRWWKDYRDKRRPIFYSQIGQICRKPGIHKSLLYVWQKHTRNWCKIVKDLHRKRWPLHYGLTIGFFAEFCFARKWGEKNLFEVCAMLPGYGVGCKLWKPSYSGGGTAGGAGGVGREKRGTQVFVPESIDFRLRPFKGKVVGSTYFNGSVVRRNHAPAGKTLGGWNYRFPDYGAAEIRYQTTKSGDGNFPDSNYDMWLYRPSFPPMALAAK